MNIFYGLAFVGIIYFVIIFKKKLVNKIKILKSEKNENNKKRNITESFISTDKSLLGLNNFISNREDEFSTLLNSNINNNINNNDKNNVLYNNELTDEIINYAVPNVDYVPQTYIVKEYENYSLLNVDNTVKF